MWVGRELALALGLELAVLVVVDALRARRDGAGGAGGRGANANAAGVLNTPPHRVATCDSNVSRNCTHAVAPGSADAGSTDEPSGLTEYTSSWPFFIKPLTTAAPNLL